MMKGDLYYIGNQTFVEDQSGYLVTWDGIEEEVSPDAGDAEALDERKER